MDKKIQSDVSLLTIKIGTIFSVGFASLMLIRAGYRMGVGQSRKILRKCDKEYKRLEKLEKRILKEQKRQDNERLGISPAKRWRRVS